MGLRVLSGIIIPNSDSRDAGTAIIDFHPHGVQGDAPGHELREMGDDAPFTSRPSKVVSLRRVQFTDTDKDTLVGGAGGNHTEGWNINDHFDATGRNSLEIEWSTHGSSKVREISYMIIGDSGE